MVYQGASLDPLLPPAVAGPAFLPDGTEVWVRPLQASDGELVRAFLEHETPEAIELRYFSALRPVLAQEETGPPTSPSDRLCLLVLGDRPDRVAVLGVGEYTRMHPDPAVAEVGFLVAEAFRGRGIATLLLSRLARAARAFGVVRFEARVRAESPEILEVFSGTGLPLHHEPNEGEIDVMIPLGPEVGSSASIGGKADGRGTGPGTTSATGPGDGSVPGRPRPSGLRSRT